MGQFGRMGNLSRLKWLWVRHNAGVGKANHRGHGGKERTQRDFWDWGVRTLVGVGVRLML